MNFLCVVVLLIAGATAQGWGSLKPSDHRAGRGPHGAGCPPHGGKCFPLPCRLPGGQVPLCGIPLNPNDTISLQFTPVFRADNVTLQNTNITLPIKQGRSIFLLPSCTGPPPKHGRKPPQPLMSYVKILYNSNSTTPFSFEFGVTKPRMSPLMAGSESDEETLQ